TNHAYTPFLFLYSKPLWNKLSGDEQAALRECAVKGGAEERRINRELNAKSLEKMQKAGLQYNTISPAQQAGIREKVQQVYGKTSSTVGADVADRMQKSLKDLRAKNAA